MPENPNPLTTCEVCERTARMNSHPCRFEKACQCWYGIPCTIAQKPVPTPIYVGQQEPIDLVAIRLEGRTLGYVEARDLDRISLTDAGRAALAATR